MAPSLSPTLQAERRAQQHWFEDGLPSLIAGMGCLVLAFFMLYLKNGHSPFKIVLLLSALTLYWAISQHHLEIVDWLKAKLSYPRTGYVRPPHLPEDKSLPLDFTMLSMKGVDTTPPEEIRRAHAVRTRRFLIGFFLVLVTFVAIAYFRSSWIYSPWIYSAFSLFFVAVGWLTARTEHRPVSWILLVGILLVGFCMSVLQLRGIVGPGQVGYCLAGIGLVALVDGAVSLFRFLRHNPRPTSTAP